MVNPGSVEFVADYRITRINGVAREIEKPYCCDHPQPFGYLRTEKGEEIYRCDSCTGEVRLKPIKKKK